LKQTTKKLNFKIKVVKLQKNENKSTKYEFKTLYFNFIFYKSKHGNYVLSLKKLINFTRVQLVQSVYNYFTHLCNDMLSHQLINMTTHVFYVH